MFDGDEGGLEVDQRKTLVVLMKNRFITPHSNAAEWRALIKAPSEIKKRLNDVFLDLVIDTEREVAYKRGVRSDSGGREFPTLLHETTWKREETALLVYLRVKFRTEQSRGEMRAHVGRAELLEYLRENRPASATNQVRDDQRANRAVDALKSAGLLLTTDEDEVYAVSPVIETMLPAPVLTNLLTWLTAPDASGPGPATDEW